MGGACTKSARVGVNSQPDISAAVAHVRKALALSSEGGSRNSPAMERELNMALQELQPSKKHPKALSKRSVTFQTMLSEDAPDDEEIPDDKVVSWLRETLEGGSAGNSGTTASAASSADADSTAQLPTALWVLPDVMKRCLSGQLFEEPLSISEAATADSLAALDTWDYDTLALQAASGGHALLLLAEAMLSRHDLYEHCGIDREIARRFFRALEACYGNNPYHNAMHGCDVAVGVHRFLCKFGLVQRLSKLQLLAALIAALVHDFNHPGTNNGHEVRARTERARTHADSSVLERHHLHSTFTLLEHFDLFGGMPAADRDACRKLIIETVLATDLSHHFDFVSRLRELASEHGHAATAPWYSHGQAWASPFLSEALVDLPLLLGVAVKFADLGHCFKPLALHKQWSERVTNEFWALGDHERSLGVAISPLCDRATDTDMPKSQIGFFKFVCMPFYSVVADLVEPTMLPWLRVQANLQTWQLHNGSFKTKLRATGQAAVLSRSITTVGTPAVRNAARIAEIHGASQKLDEKASEMKPSPGTRLQKRRGSL